MNNSQVVEVVDKYCSIIEKGGVIDDIELTYLLKVMFIDEFYEYLRDREILNDCTVRLINNWLDFYKERSNLAGDLDEVFPLNHFLLPDEFGNI